MQFKQVYTFYLFIFKVIKKKTFLKKAQIVKIINDFCEHVWKLVPWK